MPNTSSNPNTNTSNEEQSLGGQDSQETPRTLSDIDIILDRLPNVEYKLVLLKTTCISDTRPGDP